MYGYHALLSGIFSCVMHAYAYDDLARANHGAAPSFPAPSTLTLPITASSSNGQVAFFTTLTVILNPTPSGGAFGPTPTTTPQPLIPLTEAPCTSLDSLVDSCTTVPGFDRLPLSAQAQCLCNVGPWDYVADACYSLITSYGNYWATALSSKGLLGVCSRYAAGPTSWPATMLQAISSQYASAAAGEASMFGATPAPLGSSASMNGSANVTKMSSPGSATTEIDTTVEMQPTTSMLSQNWAPGRQGGWAEAWVSSLMWILLWLAGI